MALKGPTIADAGNLDFPPWAVLASFQEQLDWPH